MITVELTITEAVPDMAKLAGCDDRCVLGLDVSSYPHLLMHHYRDTAGPVGAGIPAHRFAPNPYGHLADWWKIDHAVWRASEQGGVVWNEGPR